MARTLLSLAVGLGLALGAVSAEEDGKPRVWRAQRPAADAVVPKTEDRGHGQFVSRLKYAPANEVAAAITALLAGEVQAQLPDAAIYQEWKRLDRQPVIVPEPVSNSLLVSADPQTCAKIERLLVHLDQPPRMVTVQVLIAQLRPAAAEGAAAQRPAAGGDSGKPGILGLPDGTQLAGGLAKELGLSEAASAQGKAGLKKKLRGLKKSGELEIVSRPQLTAVNNQKATLQIGERAPRITASQKSAAGRVNSVTYENVGLLLEITPRIGPDGLVIMEVKLERSQLGPAAEGVPIAASSDGETIRAQTVETLTAQTTLAARDGQSVVLGGLSSKSESRRSQLLIVLTPHVLDTAAK